MRLDSFGQSLLGMCTGMSVRPPKKTDARSKCCREADPGREFSPFHQQSLSHGCSTCAVWTMATQRFPHRPRSERPRQPEQRISVAQPITWSSTVHTAQGNSVIARPLRRETSCAMRLAVSGVDSWGPPLLLAGPRWPDRPREEISNAQPGSTRPVSIGRRSPGFDLLTSGEAPRSIKAIAWRR